MAQTKLYYWFRLSRSALIFECLLFGFKDRDLLILVLPDVSAACVTGFCRGLSSWIVARSPLKMPATDAGETSGRRSISRPRFLNPKSKHSNISADRESLNQKKLYLQICQLIFTLCEFLLLPYLSINYI